MFTVRDIVVEVNTGSPVLPGQVAPTIDWPASFPLDPRPGDRVGYEVETGDPDNPVLIDFRGTPLVGIAAAHVVLEIGDNVFVSGAFSFRMGEVETVTVEQGGLLPDITGLNVRTIKIGAEGVSVFLGDGLADYDIDADIADYLSTDTPALVLPGETVGNLVDGKIYRLVGSALGSPDLAAGIWRRRIIRTSRSGGRWRPISWVATRRRSRSGRRSGCSTRRWAPTACSSGRAAPSGERRAVEPRLADYAGAGWVELSVFFNGDGTLNMDELGPDAVGLLYRGRRARFGVGVGADARRASPLNNAHRTKSFTALKATAASAGLVGFEDAGFVFTVRDIVVEVNTGSPVLPGQVAPTIDWAGSFPLDPNVRVTGSVTRSRPAIRTTRC